MIKNIQKKLLGFLVAGVFCIQHTNAQSPDSRVCYCFANPVSNDFMLGTRATYGHVGVTLSRGLELKPKQSERVTFTIPSLLSKQSCRSTYSIYIADADNKKIYESEGSVNTITYSFPDCNKTYNVVLMVHSKSAAGRDGNCSRRIDITVKPECNTVACNCDKSNFNISGKVQCLAASATANKYVYKFDIVNKSDCILNVVSLSVLGQTTAVPSYNTAPNSTTPGISLGFSTPLSVPRPEGNLNVSVKYMMNGRKCTVIMKLPYEACR